MAGNLTQINLIKIFGRVGTLAVFLISFTGPWLIDSHPSTQERCLPPLVWLGNNMCACLITLLAAIKQSVTYGPPGLLVLSLLPLLPFLTTVLIFAGKERRFFSILHMVVLGLVSTMYSLFLFIRLWVSHPVLFLWGAGLYGLVSISLLVFEILITRLKPRNLESVNYITLASNKG